MIAARTAGAIGAILAASFAAIACTPVLQDGAMEMTLTGCQAVDGDTLRCDGRRYRLLGINAAEMPGKCRANRECPPGDPLAQRRRLAELLDGPISAVAVTIDRYDRPVIVARKPHRSEGSVDTRLSGSFRAAPSCRTKSRWLYEDCIAVRAK